MQLAQGRVFITGGAGFIGSHIVQDLLDAGALVTVFDNFSTGLEENLDGLDGPVEVIKGDILDYASLVAAMRDHDVVSHQAAQLEITRGISDPIYDLTTNAIGTLNVLRAVQELGIPKLVEASSAGVYGQAVADQQTEEDATEPNWEYGVSKLACEKYAAIACERTPGLAIASLRYAIVYGEREWYGRVLTLFLKRALARQPPVIFGDGEQVRDFVYVGDICALHRQCLTTDFEGHLVLNGSSGTGTSIRELAQLICEIAELDSEPIFDDVEEGQRSEIAEGRLRLPSELRTMRMSWDRAAREVGWAPKMSLREGVAREWRWLCKQSNRWTAMSY
jgi:UDP-glucose 4-epimerase